MNVRMWREVARFIVMLLGLTAVIGILGTGVGVLIVMKKPWWAWLPVVVVTTSYLMVTLIVIGEVTGTTRGKLRRWHRRRGKLVLVHGGKPPGQQK